MTNDHRVRIVLFIGLISAAACQSQNGATSQRQHQRQVGAHQHQNVNSTGASSVGRIAAILVAKPRPITSGQSPAARLVPEQAASSANKSVKEPAGKPRSQLGKRQAADFGAIDSNFNKPSRRNEDAWFLDQAPLPLQPYRFTYNVKDKNGLTEQYRQESGDGKFLTGSYGYVLPDGIFRHVDYVADDRGFRAFIRTSEPGTANQNPADVVINSSPVPGAGGYNPSTISSTTAANSADQSLALLGVQAQRLPLPVAATGSGSNWNDSLGIWNQSLALSNPFSSERLKIGSFDLSSVRRAPGSIVGTPLRNFSSFAYAPVGAGGELPQSTGGQQRAAAPSASRVQTLNSFADLGRLRPLGSSNLTGLGDQSSARRQSDGQLEQNRAGPSLDSGPFSNVINLDHYRHRAGLFLPSRVGPNILLYDRPFGVQPALLSQDSHKLAYDYNQVLAGDPVASLRLAEERAKSLAQLERLRALSPSGTNVELAPREDQRENYKPAPSIGAIGQTGPQTPTGATKTASSSSHTERRQEHKSTITSSQLIDDTNRLSVTRNQGAGLHWASGRESSSSSRQSTSDLPTLTTPMSSSSPPPPPLLQPPPQPLFNQQRWAQQVKGQSARLFAPYAEERHLEVKGKPQELPTQQFIDEAQQRQLTTTIAASSTSPSPSSPPSTSSQSSQPATTDEPKSSSSGAMAGVELEHAAAPKAQQHVRSVRMPDDWRTSMMMSDLRHMQSAFGLPQPPRLQRSSPSPSFSANLAEQLVAARMARVDSLLGEPHRHAARSSQREASVQQAVAIPAGKLQTDNSLLALSKSQPIEANLLDDDQPRRSTSPPASLGQKLAPNSSQSGPGRNQSNESPLFDAQRLESRVKLPRSDRVSELEKFQQRLKTQQLLLEQVNSNEGKLAQRQQQLRSKLAATNNQTTPHEANSHVKYDDHQDNELASAIRPDSDQEPGSRARRQNDPKPSELNRSGPRESEFTRQLQQWPSVSAGFRRQSAAPETNNSNEPTAQNSLKAHKMDNMQKTDTASPDAQKQAKPLEGNATNPRAILPNTINLDFINSVTALSMDQLNPFAISSVNPAIQRSIGAANSDRLLPHRLDLPLVGGSQSQQAQTGGAGMATNLLATAAAKYLNSPELMAAVDHHERHDDGQRMRNLLDLNRPVSPTNHRQVGGGPTSSSTEAGHSPGQSSTPAAPEQAHAASRGLDGLLGTRLIVAPAPSSLMSAAADSQHKSVLPPLARSGQSRGRSQAINAVYRRDGFEIRDRNSHSDNHRFYEVVSSVRQPDEMNFNYQAFRDAQLSVSANS